VTEFALRPQPFAIPTAPRRAQTAKQLGAVIAIAAAILLVPIPEIIRVVFLGILVVVVGLIRPGIGMLFACVLTIVDGAVRKWWMPATSSYVYLEKDILLLACYLGALRLGWWRLKRGAEFAWLEVGWGLLSIVVVIELLLMRGDDAYVALNGARMYLLYMPLCWLLPEYLSRMSLATLRRGVTIFILILIPMAVLATVQFRLPQDSVVNRYATGTASDVALFGEEKNVRATGTFSFISGFTDFVNFAGALTAGLLIAGTAGTAIPFAMICAFWCGICSGSRLSAIWLVTQMIMIILLSMSDLKIRRGVRLLVILLVVGYGLFALGARFGTIGAFQRRAESADDSWDRVRGTLQRPIHSVKITSVFGEGLGTTYQQLLVHSVLVTSALERYDEVADDRFIVELGLSGLLVEMIWRIGAVLICFRFFRAARNPQVRSLLAALLAYQAMFVWSYPLYDAVASIYYSASLALALSLRRIDRDTAPDAA
jgi:hypothetical protein